MYICRSSGTDILIMLSSMLVLFLDCCTYYSFITLLAHMDVAFCFALRTSLSFLLIFGNLAEPDAKF
ncbi:hypothetical protein EV361DRAFT_197896 [Lentinula raphanica]|nr:hypothetical protein EV361DRAFT_197896 [Lentinula raphanica]